MDATHARFLFFFFRGPKKKKWHLVFIPEKAGKHKGLSTLWVKLNQKGRKARVSFNGQLRYRNNPKIVITQEPLRTGACL